MAISRSPSTIHRSSALQSSINGLIVHVPANKMTAVGKRLMNQQNGQIFNEVNTFPIRQTPAARAPIEHVQESVALETIETKQVIVDDSDDDLDDVDMSQETETPVVAAPPKAPAKKAAAKKAPAKKAATKPAARRRAATEDFNDLV